jgi:hypothetical protein
MDNYEMFETFDRLIPVDLCGKRVIMPENNTILRGLQFIELDAVSEGEFCWNGECLNCQVWVRNGEKEKGVIGCRTNVQDGMSILRVSDEIAAVLGEK